MIKLSRDGQIYEFLSRYSTAPIPRDLCSLVRALIFNIIKVFCLGLCLAFLVWGFSHGLFEVLAYAFRGYVVWVPAVTIAVSVFLLIGVVAIGAWLDDRAIRRAPKEPGVVRQAYAAWKEKVCPIVQWESDHD